MTVEIDESRANVLMIRWGRTISDIDAVQATSRVEAYADRGTRFIVVVDTRLGGIPNAKQRRLFTDSAQRVSKIKPCPLVACAVSVSSPVVRGAMRALEWVFSPTFPMKVFDGVAPALEWGRSRLGATSAHPSP